MSHFKRITATAANIVLAMLEGKDEFGTNHYKNFQCKPSSPMYLNEYQNGRERGYSITCFAPYEIKTKNKENLTIIFYENRNSDHFIVMSFFGNNLWINDFKNLPQEVKDNWGDGQKWFQGNELQKAADYIAALIDDYYEEVA